MLAADPDPITARKVRQHGPRHLKPPHQAQPGSASHGTRRHRGSTTPMASPASGMPRRPRSDQAPGCLVGSAICGPSHAPKCGAHVRSRGRSRKRVPDVRSEVAGTRRCAVRRRRMRARRRGNPNQTTVSPNIPGTIDKQKNRRQSQVEIADTLRVPKPCGRHTECACYFGWSQHILVS